MDSKMTMVEEEYLEWVSQRIIELVAARTRIAEMKETLGMIVRMADEAMNPTTIAWERERKLALRAIYELAKETLQSEATIS